MECTKIMKNTYINIQSWMITDLDLKGNDLMIYAIIYGFCQDGISHFKGGRSYLAQWTNSTVRGVQKNLNKLIDNGILAKEEKIINGVKVCEYYPINLPWEKSDDKNEDMDCEEVNDDTHIDEQSSPVVGNKVPQGREQSSLGVGNKVPWGGEQSSPNNIKSNIKGNINTYSSSDSEADEKQKSIHKQLECIVMEWNKLETLGIKKVSKLTSSSKRYKMLRSRLEEYGLDDVLLAIEKIRHSSFLQGRSYGNRKWKITFDWFVCPSNFPKVLEGNYDNDNGGGSNGGCGEDTAGYKQASESRSYVERGDSFLASFMEAEKG